MDKDELIDYLIEEAGHDEAEVEQMSELELLTAWLEYNGICGYEFDILEVVKASGITRTEFFREL